MTRGELLEKYQRQRAEAAELGTMLPAAKAFEVFIDDLLHLDGMEDAERSVGAKEACAYFGVGQPTFARWCREKRFSGAYKTSGDNGEWRIPVSSMYSYRGPKGVGKAS